MQVKFISHSIHQIKVTAFCTPSVCGGNITNNNRTGGWQKRNNQSKNRFPNLFIH